VRGALAPYYAALLVGICIGTSGQLLLKTGAVRAGSQAAQFFDIFTLLGLGAYAAAAMLYIVAIRKIPLSQAYPTVALSYAVVAIAAHFLWGERIGWGQVAGMILIWSGILLLHRT
jgi:drug/metabolite transporter (DMT)-like permease